MATTLETARKRIENAEIVAADFRGERQDGLSLQGIGEYTIVDDGQDRWLILTADLEDGIEEIVGDVLDGNYDKLDDALVELRYTAYSDLCQATSCIYSRIGSPSDIADVAALDVDSDTLTEIVEALAVEEDLETFREKFRELF